MRLTLIAGLACATSFGQGWWRDPLAAAVAARATPSLCSIGLRQSPIEIESRSAMRAPLPALDIRYAPFFLVFEHLDHVFEVNQGTVSTLSLGPSPSETYRLYQFHFHTPSEHRIDGVPADMELHLVHQNPAGETLILAVMLRVDPTRANAMYTIIFDQPPGTPYHHAAPGGMIHAARLMPSDLEYYAYDGSLSNAPCTKGVRWAVLKSPVYIAPSVAETYRRLLTEERGTPANNRPIQQTNGRRVFVSK